MPKESVLLVMSAIANAAASATATASTTTAAAAAVQPRQRLQRVGAPDRVGERHGVHILVN